MCSCRKRQGPCIGCLYPDMVNDDRYPCPGTPAIADILQAVGALAVYAVDTLSWMRARTWNYRRINFARWRRWMARQWCRSRQRLPHVLVGAPMDQPTLPIDQIQVGFRYRKDLGDLRLPG